MNLLSLIAFFPAFVVTLAWVKWATFFKWSFLIRMLSWGGAGLLMYFAPFGPDVPHYVYFLIVGVATMFGAWEGGLTGIATENKNLRKFHHDIEAGKYLILIYARKEQGAKIRSLMRTRHPEAEFVAVNKHFVNPFRPVRRRHHVPHAHDSVLQRD